MFWVWTKRNSKKIQFFLYVKLYKRKFKVKNSKFIYLFILKKIKDEK